MFSKAMSNHYDVNEKSALTLSSTKNARVNLFFKLTRDAHLNDNFYTWIYDSYKEDPLDTYKIIFNARDCRGGKGDRQTFIKAYTYIANFDPYSWKINCDHIPFYGRYSDWIEIINESILSGSEYDVNIRSCIIKLISNQLNEDIENMNKGKPVSLLAKWLPSENKKWDKKTNIIKYICIELFNVDQLSNYHYKMYRTKYISKLRNYINIVETYMCKGKWDEIDFSKVPSVAMNRLKKAFQRHTPNEFTEWILKVKNNESKINAKQLYPHDIVKQYLHVYTPIDDVIEEQWKVIIDEASKLGNFENSIVLSDVSGSMTGTPMEVSIALGIIISSLTAEPFKNQIITFHENPTFHHIPDACTTLYDKVKNIENMSWGGTTSFNKVFKLILDRAIKFNLSKDDMPKRLYILSDMQFDVACTDNNMTNFEYIKDLYRKNGYDMPQIIFWNLRSDTTNDFPVKYDENNTALISGFSVSILKHLMNSTDYTPYSIMRETIDDKRYDKIKLYKD